MVTLTETGHEIYVSTVTIVIYNYYDSFEKTLNHLKNLKLKTHLEENIEDFCAAILVDSERLDSGGAFNTKHLRYITCIFEDTFDYLFHIW